MDSYELFEKTVNETLTETSTTIHVNDDKEKIALIYTNGTETNIRFQFTNHLGSSSLELDEHAHIISYEEYHPFGTTSYRSGRSEAEVSLKRYKYVFKELDNETGLYYYGMRYYAPWLARFVSVDPLQFKYPYYTPFQYAGNMPISNTDIDGSEPNNKVDEKKSKINNENSEVDNNWDFRPASIIWDSHVDEKIDSYINDSDINGIPKYELLQHKEATMYIYIDNSENIWSRSELTELQDKLMYAAQKTWGDAFDVVFSDKLYVNNNTLNSNDLSIFISSKTFATNVSEEYNYDDPGRTPHGMPAWVNYSNKVINRNIDRIAYIAMHELAHQIVDIAIDRFKKSYMNWYNTQSKYVRDKQSDIVGNLSFKSTSIKDHPGGILETGDTAISKLKGYKTITEYPDSMFKLKARNYRELVYNYYFKSFY